MAAVDRFEFLLREITKSCADIRDGLALLGMLYTAEKTLKVTKVLLETLNMHVFSKLSRSCDLSKKFGPWAVVTGGSEGIGFAYARELARRSINVVLISRNLDKLKKAASVIVVTGSSDGIGRAYARELAVMGMNLVLISKPENRLYKTARGIEEEFQVQTCCIPVDFSVGREAYSIIWEGIKDKEIGILVNNVGVMYDYPQLFLDVPVDRLWQIVNINVATATMMTHMVLPQMVERGRGAVVVVSSGACSQITPMMTVYAGTKSFLDYFARALRYEYKGKGIVIQSLRPFYVNTKMTQYSQTLTRHNTLVPSAEVYARHAVATLEHSGRTTGYWPHTLQMWISEFIPEWLWMWGAMRLNTALQRQAVSRLEKKGKMKTSDSLNTMAEIKKSDSLNAMAEIKKSDSLNTMAEIKKSDSLNTMAEIKKSDSLNTMAEQVNQQEQKPAS